MSTFWVQYYDNHRYLPRKVGQAWRFHELTLSAQTNFHGEPLSVHYQGVADVFLFVYIQYLKPVPVVSGIGTLRAARAGIP